MKNRFHFIVQGRRPILAELLWGSVQGVYHIALWLRARSTITTDYGLWTRQSPR